eukprot:3409650-Rhodomonas_salina.5
MERRSEAEMSGSSGFSFNTPCANEGNGGWKGGACGVSCRDAEIQRHGERETERSREGGRERERERERDRRRQRERGTYTHRNKDTDRHTDRHRHTQTHTQTWQRALISSCSTAACRAHTPAQYRSHHTLC